MNLKEIILILKLKKQLKDFDMKHWRTSLASVLGLALALAPKFFPNPIVLEVCTTLKDMALAGGLLVAADAANKGAGNPLKP